MQELINKISHQEEQALLFLHLNKLGILKERNLISEEVKK